MTEAEKHGEDCPRCGSLLPDEEEGLCPTCGYEFGRATLYMPVIRLGDDNQASSPDQVKATTVEVFDEPPPAQPQAMTRRKWVLLAVALCMLLAFLVFGAFAIAWVAKKARAQTSLALVYNSATIPDLSVGDTNLNEQSWRRS